MPKQYYRLSDFSGGFNDLQDARDLKDNELASAENISLEQGGHIETMGLLTSPASPPANTTGTIKGGYGYFYFGADHKTGSGAADTGENYIAMSDTGATADIDMWDETGDAWVTGVVDLGFNANQRTVFHFADEALRVCDVNNTTNNKPKWYGYIDRVHFNDSNSYAQAHDNWFSKDNELTLCKVLQIAAGYPGGGALYTGFHLDITNNASPVGTWEGKTYQIACSFIYDDKQESLLYVPTSNNTFTPNEGDSLSLTVRAKATFSERVSGARIYVRQNDTDNPWVLLLDISLRDGVRAKLGSNYVAWADGANTDQVDATPIVSIDPNLVKYETLNGFMPDEPEISNIRYKTSVVAHRRCFIANVITKDEDYIVTKYRDRIMYSPVNRFDTFPTSFYIDVVRGDAEEYVKLHAIGDKLLAFKQRTLFIINIAAPSPTGWFLEGQYPGRGVMHPAAVSQHSVGITWANEFGCFLYDGDTIKNLTQNKIDEATWSSFITDNSIVAIVPKKDYIFVVDDADKSSAKTMYIYNARNGAWVKNDSILTDAYPITNFIIDWDGDVRWAVYNGTAGTSRKWADNATNVSANDFIVTTKDIDFGTPERYKRFYGGTITYKSTSEQTTPISYALNGSGSFSNCTGNFAIKSDWGILNFTVSATNAQSVQLKVTNPTNAGQFEINDIQLEYRPIYKTVA